jgi:hypothetical protein
MKATVSTGWRVNFPDVPPPPNLPTDPAAVIRARNEAVGLALDAETMTPGWLGERLNVGYAIDVLHPLAVGAYLSRPAGAPPSP